MKNLIFYSMIFLFLSNCQSVERHHYKWTLAFKNDREGNALLGSKHDLIKAIRQGASVRIGWGSKGKTRSIEHLSDPIWLAVLNEKEVVARLDPQVGSKVNWEDLSADYSDSSSLNTEWRVVISTKGTFDAVWINRSTHEVNQRRPQRHPMTWFVKDYDPASDAPLPLFKNE